MNKKYMLPAAAAVLVLAIVGIALLGGGEEPKEPTIEPIGPAVTPDPPPVVTPDPVPTPDPTPTPDPAPAKYKRPEADPNLCWSLEVARLGQLDPNRDIYGFELQLIEDKDGYEVRPGMGDCDKITGIRLYPDRIEIWLDADYELLYAGKIGAAVTINQPEGTERAQETSELWEETLGQAGEEHKITVKFARQYPAGSIFNLHITYGKID